MSVDCLERWLQRGASLASVVGVALAASLLGGCAADYSVDFGYLSSPPVQADIAVTFEQIRLQDGYAVAVIARPLKNDDKMDWETTLELEPTDRRVVDLERLEFDEEREERKEYDRREGDWRYTIWGRAPGAASLQVWIDGEHEAEIPVLVSAQPDGP